MMEKLNNPLITLIAVALFIALAVYSCEPKMASNQDMADFVQKQLAEYKQPRKMAKEHQIMEIWNLTRADLDKPVNLWSK